MNTPSTTPAPAAGFDLAGYAHPHYDGEWRMHPDNWGSPKVVGFAEPDSNGVTVYVDRSFTRDELPELIAFLTAVHAASGADATAAVTR